MNPPEYPPANTHASPPPARASLKWTVGGLMRAVADALSARFGVVTVTGELSQLTRAGSGHWYFTLKDESAGARCVMFRAKNTLVDFAPREGQLVELRAQVSVYEPRGDLQLIVESMKPGGLGALYEQFLALKAKLEAEGLFDAARKRPIVPLPRAVGIVTSLNAAALRDVTAAFARRAPHVRLRLYPAIVQGAQAPLEIATAINTASKRAASDELDTLLVVRGGGALEDLMAFNDERVARALAACKVPVISGVGHETDFTIADFVADVRAPTPTAAAELAAAAREDLIDELDETASRVMQGMERMMSRQSQRLDAAEITLAAMKQVVGTQHARLAQTAARLSTQVHAHLRVKTHTLDRYTWKMANYPSMLIDISESIHRKALTLQTATRAKIARHTQQLAALERTAEVLSPQRTLERGYSVLLASEKGQDHAIRSVKELNALSQVRAVLADGVTELLLARQGTLL